MAKHIFYPGIRRAVPRTASVDAAQLLLIPATRIWKLYMRRWSSGGDLPSFQRLPRDVKNSCWHCQLTASGRREEEGGVLSALPQTKAHAVLNNLLDIEALKMSRGRSTDFPICQCIHLDFFIFSVSFFLSLFLDFFRFFLILYIFF